ncbi:MAG: hypothetical protein ACJ758_10155 [Actinomycetota bacterium]
MRIGPAKRVIEVDPVEEPVPGLVPEEPIPVPNSPTEPSSPEPERVPESVPESVPEPEKEPAGSRARSGK